MEKVLVTGSAGFIGGYLVDELLKQGYSVVGLDNLSKYGRVSRSFDENSKYRFVQGDAADAAGALVGHHRCPHVVGQRPQSDEFCCRAFSPAGGDPRGLFF